MLLTRRSFRARSRLEVSLFSLLAGACGSRGEGNPQFFGDPLQPLPPFAGEVCVNDFDCELSDACLPRACQGGLCVDLAPIDCDDGDPCTEDTCQEGGACENRALVADVDGDGHPGPRPGYPPGEPGSCGDDCDDTSARAYPGGVEACDGLDNDCNGIVDEDADYRPVEYAPVLLSEGAEESSVGALAFNGSFYGVTFASEFDAWENTFKGVEANGSTAVSARSITSVNSDTFTGPLVWNGALYGAVWEDRRDGDFEIYFNRLTAQGEKLGPDVRVTNAPDFSLRPSMIWNGVEFVTVWADRRNARDDYRVYGQRIRVDGELAGGNVELTASGLDADAPDLARGSTTLGMAFGFDDGGVRRVGFVVLEPDLTPRGGVIVLSGESAVGASVVFNGDRYVVAWSLREDGPGTTIRGAAILEDGTVVVEEKAITRPAEFARSQSMLPLGDRLLLVWSEWRSDSYDVFTSMLGPDLSELTPASQVTFSTSDATAPVAAFGPEGDVGIIYEDAVTGSFQVYFTRLTCGL